MASAEHDRERGRGSLVILGFDPGTANTGWGVVERCGNRLTSIAYGCIVTSAKRDTHQRLRQIHDEARALIVRFTPDVVVLEELFVNVNVKTALAVGQAKGVLYLAASLVEAPPCEYSPLEIKRAVTGYGRASKLQVQEMTKVILGLPSIPRPDHAADALAVAITHAHACDGLVPARRSPTPSGGSASAQWQARLKAAAADGRDGGRR